ncbi:hypothetical protein QBC35DRAFT_447147 [Podospora australis]|uniref:Uncharacterized protein n=1 Tax=Podospora australis TaxID=1536484 RepID=A0AAN7APD4_9PEZI|nr:hypothetical protein QBC35DRAFT_447147 [Podospora australis]
MERRYQTRAAVKAEMAVEADVAVKMEPSSASSLSLEPIQAPQSTMAAVAPMDFVVKNEPTTNIPLKCFICPRKPNFSDVSHLLTHISSKSHLSHEFKVGLRARTDQAAQQVVARYNAWVEQYDIHALLADRLSAKEQKNTGTRRGRPSKSVKAEANNSTRVVDNTIKAEPEDSNQRPTASGWASSASGALNPQNSRQGVFDSSKYQTPTMKRTRDGFSIPNTPDNNSSSINSSNRRYGSETATTTDSIAMSEIRSESTDYPEEDNDLSKLKGVIYPGMSLFDSATEEQKRRRNQRKDDSVLELMEKLSKRITPFEFVEDMDLNMLRTRNIYDPPTPEGSPEPELAEPDNIRKKKRTRRPTQSKAAEKPRRSSTRLTEKTAKLARLAKPGPDEESLADDEEINDSRVSSHSHGSAESYDVFRDAPKPSPVQQHSSWVNWGSHMTEGTGSSTARTHSPLDDSGFELRRSTILRPVSATNYPVLPTSHHSMSSLNPALNPSASDPASAKNHSTHSNHPNFPSRDTTNSSSYAPQHLSIPTHNYFQNQQTIGGSSNPLCVQPRSSNYYHSYSFPSYGSEQPKPPTGFQSGSTMHQHMSHIGFGGFGQFMPEEAEDHDDDDYNL